MIKHTRKEKTKQWPERASMAFEKLSPSSEETIFLTLRPVNFVRFRWTTF